MNIKRLSVSAYIAAAVLLLVPVMALADHPLPETPVATHTVVAAEDCSIDSNLTIGSRGESVACLQDELRAQGLLRTSITGYYGNLTKTAVMMWQKARGIAATGFFGPISRAAFAVHQEPMEHGAMEVDDHGVSTGMQAHTALSVDAWTQIPSVKIVAHPDAMSGWNLEIITENFRFAPEHASTGALPNEGHAHLMVDGVKLARVYGNWFHVPADAAKGAGEHELLLTLNANDHSDLSYKGARIEARATVMTK